MEINHLRKKWLYTCIYWPAGKVIVLTRILEITCTPQHWCHHTSPKKNWQKRCARKSWKACASMVSRMSNCWTKIRRIFTTLPSLRPQSETWLPRKKLFSWHNTRNQPHKMDAASTSKRGMCHQGEHVGNRVELVQNLLEPKLVCLMNDNEKKLIVLLLVPLAALRCLSSTFSVWQLATQGFQVMYLSVEYFIKLQIIWIVQISSKTSTLYIDCTCCWSSIIAAIIRNFANFVILYRMKLAITSK